MTEKFQPNAEDLERLKDAGKSDLERREEQRATILKELKGFDARLTYPEDRNQYPVEEISKTNKATGKKLFYHQPTYVGLMRFAESILGPYGFEWRVSSRITGGGETKNTMLLFSNEFLASFKGGISTSFFFLSSSYQSAIGEHNHVAIRQALSLLRFAENLTTVVIREEDLPPEANKSYGYSASATASAQAPAQAPVANYAQPAPQTAYAPAPAQGQAPAGGAGGYQYADTNAVWGAAKNMNISLNDFKALAEKELAKNISPKYRESLEKALNHGIKNRQGGGASAGQQQGYAQGAYNPSPPQGQSYGQPTVDDSIPY